MKKVFYLLTLIIISSLMFSCKSNEEKAIDEISQLEKELFNDSLGVLDAEKANAIIQLYHSFSENYPEHKHTPLYLFHGADVSMNMADYAMAIKMLDNLIENYPDFENIPASIHLRGFIYEDKLQQLDKAKASYQELIDKFPEHELAENAKGCIQNLGIPTEELIRMWEKQDSLKVDSAEVTENVAAEE